MTNDPNEAYKLATEAGREASKQMIVVSGGLLAGYLAFLGRPGTEQILSQDHPIIVVTFLFASLFSSVLSLAFVYNMHAARSRIIGAKQNPDSHPVPLMWEKRALWAALASYVFCLLALLTVIVTAVC